MSLQIYILAKLMEGNNYPYKLKKALSEPIPFAQMGNLTESKLYYHFDSLVKQQLIEEVEIIREDNRPDKHVFGITEKGREALPDMIYKMIEKAQSPIEMVVSINAMQYVDKNRVITILEKKIDKVKQHEKEFAAVYEQIDVEEPILQFVDVFEGFVSQTTTLQRTTYEKVIQLLKEV